MEWCISKNAASFCVEISVTVKYHDTIPCATTTPKALEKPQVAFQDESEELMSTRDIATKHRLAYWAQVIFERANKGISISAYGR